MRLLLDTHVLLWWFEGSAKLGVRARGAIGSRESTAWVSAASVWEIAIKIALGRLTMAEPLDIVIPRELERGRFLPLSISIKHGLAVQALPDHHRDPFDRMLAAQAYAEGLTVVTVDPVFDKYGVNTLPANR